VISTLPSASISGYLGLVAGVALVEAINRALINFNVENDMFKNPEVNFNTAITALIILIIAGAAAGIIPANRAVRVKPVDALRFEN
jgi:putative ABC transport system permease protein